MDQARRIGATGFSGGDGGDGGPDVFTVRTAHQTVGRGRRGSRWMDRPGEALLMTIAIRRGGTRDPRDPTPSTMALRAAAAVHAVIADGGSQAVQIKWPNDVLVNGGKAAGILLEADAAWYRIGIGVNLYPPGNVEADGATAALPPAAVSSRGPGGPPLAGDLLLWYHRVIQAFDEYLTGNRWHSVVQRNLAWRRCVVEVTGTPDGAPREGRIAGIDDRGGLILLGSGAGGSCGTREVCYAGSVRLKGMTNGAASKST